MDTRLLATFKKMQKEAEKKLKELYTQEFTYDYQNGAVMVTIFGNGVLKNIEINKTLIDPEDPITLQEMIVEAINSSAEQIKQKIDAINNSIAGLGVF